ncbi:MAG: SDR family oxidoreductase [Campylobacterales bacterium]|nr:SDR family oxidoreductase [Campylobacterales bacterium]MBN2832937.1 SDR family oxidoreductase [Campylobacterales bacterium]
MLNNKIVVIIGGAGLLGQSFVQAVEEAHGIAICADIVSAEYPVDITSKESIQALIQKITSVYGKIDAVVNSAYPRTKTFGNHFFDVEYADFCQNTNLQLGGAFLVMQQFAHYFKEQGYGNMVNISSIQGVVAPKFETYEGTPMSSPVAYSAIKAGVIHMTRYVAKYLKGTNIRVNCMSPGGILDGQNELFLKQYKDVCLNKGMLDNADLNGTLLYLLSDLSQYVNGQNIVVDDGFSL